MLDSLRYVWLPRLLFLGTLAFAGGLGLAVLGAAWAAERWPAAAVRLFAEDSTVRKTALACAAGLTATAFVFFRPALRPTPRKPRPERRDIAGA